MNAVKEIFELFLKNPSAMICTLMTFACGVIYHDNTQFIEK